VENWRLAISETDYLATEQLHSPVQHYWSLSIEEQFYVVWPLLLGAAMWLATARRLPGRPGRPRSEGTTAWTAATVVGAVFAVSLAWSVYRTSTDPAAAYFVSTTRVWELALGGLLAAVIAVRPGLVPAAGTVSPATGALQAGLAWVGLGMIGWAVVMFDAETAFPGAAALVPTAGTALVIAATADGLPGGPGRLLAWRPVQWLGNTSYAVYLWHWPVIVILPFALGRPLTAPDTLGVLAATLVLAALSQRLVEDRLRWHPLLTRNLRATFAMLAVCVVAVGGTAAGVAAYVGAAERAADASFRAAVAQAAPCVGAAVVRDPACQDPGLLTPPQVAAEDKPVVYADGCWNNTPFTTRTTCTYGASGDPRARIALVGNSHAGHWVPALEDALRTESWQLTTYLQSVCYPVDRPIALDGEGVSENCRATTRWAVDSVVTGGYDLVVLSARTHQPLDGVAPADQEATAEAAYRETLRTFTEAGIPVLVLRDTPAMPGNVPDCIAEHPVDVEACGAPSEVALEPDPLAAAARADTTGLVSVASVEDLMCDAGRCHPVVGGLIAYFDHGHLTATFARTLTPEVTRAVRDSLR
jgi:peptidoglycan/LPS O-acetylase OafA/YrhL